ncbi:MAG: hypothetical protein J6J93_11390 [Muribaculaceae bacterium]|nr:hypothetical protein [Muribaculaceae bacterium]
MSFADNLFASLKTVVKLVVESRPCSVRKGTDGGRLVIMANGPSLADTIRDNRALLMSAPSLAVNFAAISPEFKELRPRYYVLADPYFFSDDTSNENLARLRDELGAVGWKMTLLVPVKYAAKAKRFYPNNDVKTFNIAGLEGFTWLTHPLYRLGAGMPRPRNVLIPSIMLGIALGYTEIIITGADHSWMKTLSVTDENEVVSIQPHFYSDGDNEKNRVRHEYRNYRLHQIVQSFAIAFKSYHDIEAYARKRGVHIINATPGSFIDAFDRKLPDSE